MTDVSQVETMSAKEWQPSVETSTPDETPVDVVAKTWEELGYKIRPLGWKVFVRTDPPQDKVGSLFLPPKLQGFFGGLGHMRLVTATVLSIGPRVTGVKPGDRVVFRRLEFGHIVKLNLREYVGWIEEAQLCGTPLEDAFQEPLNLT